MIRHACNSVQLEELRTTASCLNLKSRKTFYVPTWELFPIATILPNSQTYSALSLLECY